MAEVSWRRDEQSGLIGTMAVARLSNYR